MISGPSMRIVTTCNHEPLRKDLVTSEDVEDQVNAFPVHERNSHTKNP